MALFRAVTFWEMERHDPGPSADSSLTNPTIFLRLNARDAQPREMAWAEFHERYVPILRAIAMVTGARGADVEDVVQDVMLGFFSKAPTFVYDPSRGRFRGYLKTCAIHAVRKRFAREAKFKSVPIQSIDESSAQIDQACDDAWEKWQLERALADVRDESRDDDTAWRAFEQTVIHGRAPAEIATELGLSLSAIYKARDRLAAALRKRLEQLRADEG
jgi:RNA polymerase sigma-70 factor (ECF subfamily)